jgi:hypothetical protein
VQASLVKCRSNNDNLDLIIKNVCAAEEDLGIMCWIERVPSFSNPADSLSREITERCRGVPTPVKDAEVSLVQG